MRKYYVSYIIVNPSQPMPIYGDTYIDIDGRLTEKAINDIKKKLVDQFNKQNNFRIPTGVRVVLSQIYDITKEEIDKTFNELNSNKSDKEKTDEEKFFMPGVIEVINGERYVGGVKEEIKDEGKEIQNTWR